MDPSVLRKDEAVQLFTEVLNHIITLGFAVDQEVQTNMFLEANHTFDLLLEEIVILQLSNFALGELRASGTNLLSLLQ